MYDASILFQIHEGLVGLEVVEKIKSETKNFFQISGRGRKGRVEGTVAWGLISTSCHTRKLDWIGYTSVEQASSYLFSFAPIYMYNHPSVHRHIE